MTVMNTIIVKELNVDGCGTDAVEHVRFDCNMDETRLNKFAEILRNVKTEAINKDVDMDTEDMINDALKLFASMTTIHGEIVTMPVLSVVTF